MRVLIVGAGALGGYFGAYLTAAGRDVTFLVRTARAAALARDGLRVVSPHGDLRVEPKTVTADTIDGTYDLILLAVKAYSLHAAMDSMASAVSADSAILPVINGLRHIDDLQARFGAKCVLGGTARISASLDAAGQVILQLANFHTLECGELSGEDSPRIRAIATALTVPGFDLHTRTDMMRGMWEKWVVLATMAGITSLMRASLGDILASPGGRDAVLGLLNECRTVAEAAGQTPRPEFIASTQKSVTTEGSPMKASMLRDIEASLPAEGEHILGDLADRARVLGISTPLLDLARCHVAAYTIGRERTQKLQE